MSVHRVYLGLGANLGDREQTILRAYSKIERLIGTIRRQSTFYYSEPWGFASSNGFVNTVIMVETAYAPLEVLHRTRLIERQLGKRREHATDRPQPTPITQHPSPISQHPSPNITYHDRPIDIDILLYDDLHLQLPRLTVPHPLMTQRPFVMEPLRQICDDGVMADINKSDL